MTADLVFLRGRQKLRQLICDRRIRLVAKVTAYAAAGFVLSAAALGNWAQPFAMGLVLCLHGWRALVMGLGSIAGYHLHWGVHGAQGMVWASLATLTALILGKRRITAEIPLLLTALGGLWVSASGLVFQAFLGEDTPVGIYFLRVALGAGSTFLFGKVLRRNDPIPDWVAEGVAVLALAQIVPVPWLNFGYIAAGAIALAESFPAAALAGLALDLARVTRVPMTAVLCALYLSRLVPGIPSGLRRLCPAGAYLLVMSLCGIWDPMPLVPLTMGGLASALLPRRPELTHRRGETGLAQVRLELMAGVLTQTQQILMETADPPLDEESLLARCRERACGSCPNRRGCGKTEPLPKDLLHKPLLDTTALPIPCKKPGRMIQELRRSQEQYRALRADRDRRREYREAVIHQYRFLSAYLRELADQLPRRGERISPCYTVELAVRTAGKQADNGDSCQGFHGTGCRYYLALCDGMGTGLGAAQEGRTALDMLKQMLCAGFPPEHALGSLNNLLALGGKAGAVTVDLAEIRLDKGTAVLYKWGAAPSYVLRDTGTEKIGTAGPPPGFDVGRSRETVDRLSLRRGEVLILLSDGVEGEAFLRRGEIAPGAPPGELAAKLLEIGAAERADDATAAVIRLHPTSLST